MMISSSSSLNSYKPLTNISTNTVKSEDSEKIKTGKGPGGPTGKEGKGVPSVDLDNDDSWSTSELDSIMSKYDTDGDGKISSTEREAMETDIAFQLPRPQEHIEMMKSTSSSDTANTGTTSSNSIKNYFKAYTTNNNYSMDNLKTIFESII
jgi:hypothetical protein